MHLPDTVEIVEVGPRDGLQIPTVMYGGLVPNERGYERAKTRY